MNGPDSQHSGERILVLVLGGLGEAIMALAPLAALRDHHSQAEITVLTPTTHVRLFVHCPYVDRIDARWPIAKPLDRVKFHWSMRNARYDMVYDLTNSEETDGLFRALQPFPPAWSGQAMGCSHPHADRARLSLHRLDRHAEQLMVAGVGPKSGYATGLAPLPDLSWTKPLAQGGDEAPLMAFGVSGPYALLLPEATAQAPDRIWPAARHVELAQDLAARGIIPVIGGSPDAQDVAHIIRAAVPSAVDAVAQLDLFSFIQVARQSRITIGSDSDVLVLAAASGGPTLAIIGPQTSNAQQAAPRGKQTVALMAKNLQSVGVQEVLASARAVAPFLAQDHSSTPS
ncbi:MAG: hypothetical protein RLZZ157_1725 [Pseudomonadota bacterium]